MNVLIRESINMEVVDLDFLFLNYFGKKDDTGIWITIIFLAPANSFDSYFILHSL